MRDIPQPAYQPITGRNLMILKSLAQWKSQKRDNVIPHSKFNEFIKIRPRVCINIKRKNFTVKTVDTRRELVQAFRLRYDVFGKEFMGKTFPVGLDQDRYDSAADHLVIIDEKVKKVVGTYRLICSSFEDRFYSASEFNLDGFISEPGVKLELSRACIAKSHRNGIVMGLLWKGLGAYMNAVSARYLFGCSSIQTVVPQEITAVYHSLQNSGSLVEEYGIHPIGEFRIEDFAESAKQVADAQEAVEEDALTKSLIPPLLNSYLKAGARIFGEPALDKKFRCIDFLTVLDVEKLSGGHQRRFLEG